jgi:RNA recognition motif-containing protein
VRFVFCDLSEAELREAFAGFDEVSSGNIIKDKFTGESRGFGFVEMPNKDEAEKAIAALNGKDMKGRNLTVNQTQRNRRDNSAQLNSANQYLNYGGTQSANLHFIGE